MNAGLFIGLAAVAILRPVTWWARRFAALGLAYGAQGLVNLARRVAP